MASDVSYRVSGRDGGLVRRDPDPERGRLRCLEELIVIVKRRPPTIAFWAPEKCASLKPLPVGTTVVRRKVD